MNDRRYLWALRAQRWVSWVNAPWFLGAFVLVMRLGARYRCPDVGRVRREMREVMRRVGDRPLIICANHLTLIDSMIINWLLTPSWAYLWNWRLMPWNMPERSNFGRSPLLLIMSYLGKCVFVKRGGSIQERRATLDKFKALLWERETVCIFPEGTRSREGRVRGSQPTYSVGELYQAVPNTMVLCVYLRGLGQHTWGVLPRRGETFAVALELIDLGIPAPGRRGAKDVAEKIMQVLTAQEDHYFATNPLPAVSPKANPTVTATTPP